MSSAPHTTTDWETFFCSTADYLKDFAAKHWPLESDGSGSDNDLALRRLFAAFPFRVEVLLFDTSGLEAHPQVEDIATAIRYDLTHPNTLSVQLRGTIPLVSINSHAQLVKCVLDLEPEFFDDLKRWPSVFGWSSAAVTHLVPYDSRTKPIEYAEELADFMARDRDLLELFSPRTDFNAKYDLVSDAPLTDEQLRHIDELTACFVKMSDHKPPSLSERHLSIADIQLIPQVPESIRRTFHLARRLYVCGYFEYGFFTVSLHYALLALDAALHARWSSTLPAFVDLTYQDKKTGPTHRHRMDQPSHVKIREFSQRAGWKVARVGVGGRSFPHTVKRVIAELSDQRFINDWQRHTIERFYVEIRNSLTHLEFAPVHTPSPDVLERVAYFINHLFDSLPLPV